MIIPGVLAIFALLAVSCNAIDYCNTTLCPDGITHIGCKHQNKFAPRCQSPVLINFGGKLQELVLHIHNEYRNMIASGATGFAQAARMPVLRWNPELAKLAEYNVRECNFEHDDCRNTASFPFAGQNLGFTITNELVNEDLIEAFVEQVQDNWYSESSVTRQEWLDMFTLETDDNIIGHFTAMIQDHMTDIGCSAVHYKTKSELDANQHNAIQMTCNYSFTNIIDFPVYTKGPEASQCKTGVDPFYTSLCSSAEVVSTLIDESI